MVFASYNMVPVPPVANGSTSMATATAGFEQRHSVSYGYNCTMCMLQIHRDGEEKLG
jgi:hypothetical protein